MEEIQESSFDPYLFIPCFRILHHILRDLESNVLGRYSVFLIPLAFQQQTSMPCWFIWVHDWNYRAELDDIYKLRIDRFIQLHSDYLYELWSLA